MFGQIVTYISNLNFFGPISNPDPSDYPCINNKSITDSFVMVDGNEYLNEVVKLDSSSQNLTISTCMKRNRSNIDEVYENNISFDEFLLRSSNDEMNALFLRAVIDARKDILEKIKQNDAARSMITEHVLLSAKNISLKNTETKKAFAFYLSN